MSLPFCILPGAHFDNIQENLIFLKMLPEHLHSLIEPRLTFHLFFTTLTCKHKGFPFNTHLNSLLYNF